MALLQLNPVPSSESCARTRAEAIALLDRQLAAEGVFVDLTNGSVIVLRLTARGWIAAHWEHPY